MSSGGAIHAKAIELGKLAVRMTSLAGSGHPTSALSLAHIVTHLLYREMRFDPQDPTNLAADRLVLSEGHAVPIVYAAFADLGAKVGAGTAGTAGTANLKISDVDSLRARDSVLDGHPNPAEGFPFFDAATGSLGMGLSVGAGLALAARREGSPRRVFVIVGDGESREGQIWEAADFVVDHKLTNLCVVFNCNQQGQAGFVSEQQSAARLEAKLKAFGWEVAAIDGHDPQAIADAFAKFGTTAAPLAVVAKTVKGWGVDAFLKGNWHGKPMPEKELDAAYKSLDAKREELRVAADAAKDVGRPSLSGAGDVAGRTAHRAVAPNSTHRAVSQSGSSTTSRVNPAEVKWPGYVEAMNTAGLGAAVEKNALATRRAYGAALKIAGDLVPQVVALDADVSNSTFAEVFAKAHPDRFFECKIAEQNMVSAGVGLSAGGLIPFVNSFSKFISRAYDQIELANISRANLKIVGSHSGISLAADGPSQMSVVDVAFFRAFTAVRGDNRTSPLCWFFNPADALTAYHSTRLMTAVHGMCYMRTYRPDVPLLYPMDHNFELGGFGVFDPGGEIALVAGGYMVHVAKQAATLLAKQGVRATVIDLYCLPVQSEKLLDALRRSGRKALAVEDNYGAGLGSLVAEIAASSGDVVVESRICQRIPKSTRTAEEILDYCGVGASQIADHAMALLRK